MTMNNKARINLSLIAFIIFIIFIILIIGIIVLAVLVVTGENKTLTDSCRKLGYTDYFWKDGESYCIKNGVLTQVIKSCTGGKCQVALK